MTVHYTDDKVTVHHGDCLAVLRTLPDNTVDAVVTDPPYGLEFMGKEWDGANGFRRSLNDADTGRDNPFGRTSRTSPEYRAGTLFQHWCELWATEAHRVLKPGGHMLAFGGTRTWHRLVCAVEDAGFEIRDSIAWLYGSGFPKSLDVSKAIDRAAGAEREVVGVNEDYLRRKPNGMKTAGATAYGYSVTDLPTNADVTAPATPESQQWAGWGTALKPGHEPICVARKPLTGTVANNVTRWGTGALNIDATRIGTDEKIQTAAGTTKGRRIGPLGLTAQEYEQGDGRQYRAGGRWPANVILDETAAETLDHISGETMSSGGSGSASAKTKNGRTYGDYQEPEAGDWSAAGGLGDLGGASRFFYTAKAATDERITHNGVAHATVKPLSLMRWLVRLVTPPGGTILDPFAGSGTTLEAAILEGFHAIGIEREADYLPLITQRIHRRRNPVTYLTQGGYDLGLFDTTEGPAA